MEAHADQREAHAAAVTAIGPAAHVQFPPTHGARSPRIIAPLADRLAAGLANLAPWAAGPAFAGTVESWAWYEAQATLLRRFLDEHGLLDEDGSPRNAAKHLANVEGHLAKLRAQLGLTPLALAKLLATLTVVQADAAASGLDALRQTGAEIRQRAALRLVASPDDDADTTADDDDHRGGAEDE